MSTPATFTVGRTAPQVLAPDEPLPAELLDQAGAGTPGAALPGDVAAPAPYWTGEKVANVVARACAALAEPFGENMKAEAWELELIEASPAASLLNDVLPGVTSSGENLSTVAKLFIVALVFGLMALLRLPTIMAITRQRQLQAGAPAEQPATAGAAPPDDTQPAPAPMSGRKADLFSGGTVGSGRIGER